MDEDKEAGEEDDSVLGETADVGVWRSGCELDSSADVKVDFDRREDKIMDSSKKSKILLNDAEDEEDEEGLRRSG
jgi:hypothetical protein